MHYQKFILNTSESIDIKFSYQELGFVTETADKTYFKLKIAILS